MSSDSKAWHANLFKGSPSENISELLGTRRLIDKRRLVLIDCVGQGSWGVVYKAQRTLVGRDYYPDEFCAVKCMAPHLMTRNQRRSIAHEIEMHRACSDVTPSVLQFICAIEDEDTGLVFIITELCEGGTLLQRINDESIVGSDERIRRTFVQILDAVAACHAAGVYHRDLKLENILFKADGQIVLADFGFATHKRGTSDFGLGSREYMSPEILGGFGYHKVRSISSRQSDIWALGIIFTILVSGRMPWKKASASDAHFLHFVAMDNDYLYHALNISGETNEILKSIFCHPRGRLTIGELRRCVLSVKTFRRCESKLNIAVDTEKRSVVISESDSETDSDTYLGHSQRYIDAHFEAAALRVINGANPEDEDITDIPVDPNIIEPSPTPPEDLQLPEAAMEEDNLDAPVHFEVILPPVGEADIAEGVFVLGSNSDSDSDGTESDGPITPETHAVDNAAIASPTGARPLEDVAEFNLADTSALPAPVPVKGFVDSFSIPPGLEHVRKWHDNATALPVNDRLMMPER
ncbi:kinase-like protein [Sanghuangporus baumii]|uniref:Kinase-like protein n=1 Tax=Sanghuangporus baumii TaxID=108892 RepID=A0A9Q5N660_SANBA|nr:kinase-like protein [Sanghuangporus baumii]